MARIPAHWVNAEEAVYPAVVSGELEIDSEGHVWRTMVRRGNRWGGGFNLVPCARRRAEHDAGKYLQVRLMVDGKRHHAAAHRLVWRHFHSEPIPEGMTINHRNGIPDDNRPVNLELMTTSDQMRHAAAGGLRDQHGQRNPNAKLTDNQVAQIRLGYDQGGHDMQSLAERFGVSFQTISKIVRGQRRAKQGGPTASDDLRYAANPRDDVTGRFLPKEDSK